GLSVINCYNCYNCYNCNACNACNKLCVVAQDKLCVHTRSKVLLFSLRFDLVSAAHRSFVVCCLQSFQDLRATCRPPPPSASFLLKTNGMQPENNEQASKRT